MTIDFDIYYDVIGVIVFVGLVWFYKHFNNKQQQNLGKETRRVSAMQSE